MLIDISEELAASFFRASAVQGNCTTKICDLGTEDWASKPISGLPPPFQHACHPLNLDAKG